MVNKGTLRLMCELFEPCEAKITAPRLKKSKDVELILDSLLHVSASLHTSSFFYPSCFFLSSYS